MCVFYGYLRYLQLFLLHTYLCVCFYIIDCICEWVTMDVYFNKLN